MKFAIELIILLGIPVFGYFLGGWVGLIIGIGIAGGVRNPLGLY